jgi:hypothetical protein
MGVYVALLPSGVAVIRPDDMTISVGLLFTIISLPSLCSPPIFGALISSEKGSASYNHPAIFGGEWVHSFERSTADLFARVYSDCFFCRYLVHLVARPV